MTHQEIFDLISRERARQDELKAMGKFSFTCADPASDGLKLAILTEEVGEVGTEVLARSQAALSPSVRESLKTELVQVAAVCLAWLETL